MRAVFIASVFLSSSLLACPDLTGTFSSCGTSITQSVTNKITTYTVNTAEGIETYHADGKTKTTTETDPDSGLTVRLSTTSTCNGTKALQIKTKLHFDGEEAASLVTTVTKSGGVLTTKISGVNMGEEINETTICE